MDATVSIKFSFFIFSAFFGLACFSQSVFNPGPVSTIPRKLCYNIGSKVDTIGPYRAEPPELIYLRTTPRSVTSKANVKGTPFKNAFSIQRTSYRELSLFVRVDAEYQYNVELGFLDSKACKKGGTEMEAVAGGNKITVKNINPYKAKGCNSAHSIQVKGAIPDAWNRLVVTLSGPNTVSLSTFCIERDVSNIVGHRGKLYLAADDAAELFLNGKFLIKVNACFDIAKTKVTLRKGDVLAVIGRNWDNDEAGVRVAFVSENDPSKSFGTQGKDWKARAPFVPVDGPRAWMSKFYDDRDWPLATDSGGCLNPDFPDVTGIWRGLGYPWEVVYIRYTFIPR